MQRNANVHLTGSAVFALSETSSLTIHRWPLAGVHSGPIVAKSDGLLLLSRTDAAGLF